MIIFCFNGAADASSKFEVLIVMSYEQDFPWSKEIKEGITEVLSESCQIRYFYMDTKTNLANGPAKASEAYALYKKIKPHGVIAVDDNAQSMFVVPYLRDRVGTPVMFCGVNDTADKYGYPASNVSGILECDNIRESILFAQQLDPSIKKIAFMMKYSPTSLAVSTTIGKEQDTYTARIVDIKLPRSIEEVVAMAQNLRDQCDAIFFETMAKVPDSQGKLVAENDAIRIAAKAFGKNESV